MGNKNSEGYPDPTASEAICRAGGNRIDYTKFETYEELRKFILQTVDRVTTRAEADEYIRRKMPKESYFQTKIMHWIRENFPEAFVWKAAAGPYSRQGIPDICCIIGGRFYGFEVKRPFIGVLRRIQEQTMKEIRAAGGVAEVVTSEKDVAEILLPGKQERKLIRQQAGLYREEIMHECDNHTKEDN